MILLAVDPGNVITGYVLLDAESEVVMEAGEATNEAFRDRLRTGRDHVKHGARLVLEQISNYGKMPGRTTFDTCTWSGVFAEAWERTTGQKAEWMPRTDVKEHLCRKRNAGDKHVRAALIARLGPQGTTANPGPLYGVTGHKLAALGVAVTYADQEALKASLRRTA